MKFKIQILEEEDSSQNVHYINNIFNQYKFMLNQYLDREKYM